MPRPKPIAAAAALLLALPSTADTPLGLPFPIAVGNAVQQPEHPVVARAADGRFTVVWALDSELRARRYSADGLPLGPAFVVGSVDAQPSVAAHDIAVDAEGEAVIAWRSREEGGRPAIRFRRYAADGSPLGAPAVADAGEPASRYGAPAVAADADGDFVIAWSRADLHDPRRLDLGIGYSGTRLTLGQREVRLRRYDRAGVALAAAETVARRADLELDSTLIGIPINGPAVGAQVDLGLIDRVDVAMDADGDHVVVWGGGSALFAYALVNIRLPYPAPLVQTSGIFARRYDARGVAADRLPTRVDVAVTGQAVGGLLLGAENGAPQVAMQGDGAWAVSWMQRHWLALDARTRVRAERFSAAGRRLPSTSLPLPVSGYSSLSPVAVAAAGAGDCVLAWPDQGSLFAARLPGGGGEPVRFEVAGPMQGIEVHPFNGIPTVAADAAGQPVFGFVAYDRDARTQGIYARRFGRP